VFFLSTKFLDLGTLIAGMQILRRLRNLLILQCLPSAVLPVLWLVQQS